MYIIVGTVKGIESDNVYGKIDSNGNLLLVSDFKDATKFGYSFHFEFDYFLQKFRTSFTTHTFIKGEVQRYLLGNTPRNIYSDKLTSSQLEEYISMVER